MASDKEGDRSLSGRGYSGGGPTSGPSTSSKSGGKSGSSSGYSGGGPTSGSSKGSGSSGYSGGGPTSGPSKSGSSGGEKSGSGREGTGGGPGGPAGTGRTSGTNATGGGGGARSVTSAKSTTGYTGGGPTGSSPRGLGFNLSPAKTATTSPSAITPSLTTGRALQSASTPTGFAPDFGKRPDLNPAVAADAKVQAALGTIRALEHRTTPTDLSVYSKVFGGKAVDGLTNMTLRQVMAHQKTMPRSRAVGAYQIKDLAWAARLAGVSLDDRFSIATQDRLAKALANRRMGLATDRKTGVVDIDKAAVEMSKEWAALKNPKTGKSNYPTNNTAVGTERDPFDIAMAFAPTTAPAAATSATVALERLAAPVPANVPTPTARPSPVNSFATRPNVPVGALPAAAQRVVSKYLGAGRPGVVTPDATNPAQTMLRDLRDRDRALGLDQPDGGVLGAGMSGTTPRSAGVGNAPPSQALAPGPVGAGFSSAISPQEGPARQVSNTGASLTSLDAPGLRTRMSGSEDIANTLRGEAVDPMDPGAIGAGFSAAGFGTVAPIGRVDTGDTVNAYNRANPAPQVGPPAASLTSRTVSQGMATALPNLPAVDTFKRDLGARTVMRSVDEAAQRTVPNLAEAPKATMTLEPGEVMPKSDIVDRVAASIAAATAPGEYYGYVISGARPGSKSGRHQTRAADVQVRETATDRPLSYANPADVEVLNRIAYTGARNYGIRGVGGGVGYMDGTATHFDKAEKETLRRSQDQDWESYNQPTQHAELARARSDYDARSAGEAGSPVTQTAGGPGSTTAATTTPTTAAPAGTGPATGPWGDDKLEPVTGPKAPEPLTQGQKVLSFLTKLGASTLGGTAGAAITALDLLDEAATGQGFIDSMIAKLDNPRTGGAAPTGFGAYAQGGHEPTLSAVRANQQRVDQRVVDKYLKPQTPVAPPAVTAPVETTFSDPTWRPTPEQKWGAQNKYSEFPYATV